MRLVSVIIPVRNGASVIGRCLNAVIGQDYPQLEIIVVDNASSDQTADLVRRIDDERIKIVYEPKPSRGAARNRGVRVANGEIIMMTDADCEVPEGWIAQMLKPLDKGEDIVVGGEINSEMNKWEKIAHQKHVTFMKRQKGDGQYIHFIDTKNFAIRKQVLISVGGFNGSLVDLEDFDLKIRLEKANFKICYLPEVRVVHHHPKQLSQVWSRKRSQGYSAAKLYFNNRGWFRKYPEEHVSSVNLVNFFLVYPKLIVLLIVQGWNPFHYELVEATAWRVGIVEYLLESIARSKRSTYIPAGRI